ncbi:MAG: calcium-binding protein, partial [Pseudomonas stutzeri]|nr:calcium-binding protein [Stutzerimonas stutzeri]
LADNDVAVEDKLFFCEGIEHHQLWFRRENSHLEVRVMGTDDVVRLNGWYSSTPTRIDAFETASGDTLFAQQVDALVQAM